MNADHVKVGFVVFVHLQRHHFWLVDDLLHFAPYLYA
jgi:hypothetical protein